MRENDKEKVFVDVIVPVHDAAETIQETVTSALEQTIPVHLKDTLAPYEVDVAVCCYDDASKDNSLSILEQIKQNLFSRNITSQNDLDHQNYLCTTPQLFIGNSPNGRSRGAGYARNQAVSLRTEVLSTSSTSTSTSTSTSKNSIHKHHFLCLLDSDDTMKPTRIAEQICYFLTISKKEDRDRILLGTTFVRDPPDSTWHYANWANQLTDERLMLERFREVTILQPTWMMTKSRFQLLGGYIEAPDSSSEQNTTFQIKQNQPYKLIHQIYDTPETLRLAEDLRLFHAHVFFSKGNAVTNGKHQDHSCILSSNELNGGLLRLLQTKEPLLVYRHRKGMSQSASTPRKLLLQLRAKAFEDTILKPHSYPQQSSLKKTSQISWNKFAIWGAGRDGKEFLKALSPEIRKQVICFVDVDWKKIQNTKFYVNKEINVKIPIRHFSDLAINPKVRKKWEIERELYISSSVKKKEASKTASFGNITKDKSSLIYFNSSKKLSEMEMDKNSNEDVKMEEKSADIFNLEEKMIGSISLSTVPVVVCVAMYRTNGVLEANVASIGRREGQNLWHFS